MRIQLLRASGGRFSVFLTGLLYLLSFGTFHSYGQFVRGTILGAVTDEGGAVVPETELTLRNQETNELRTAVTDVGGNFTFPALLPGLYRLEAKRSGFKSQVVTDIRLEVNQTARFDLKLTVGQVNESIDVLATPALLKTDTSEIGHVISNKSIVDLPLNGRDYLQLARLIPGVAPSRSGATLATRGVNRSINSVGARDTSVAYLLDGVDTNDVGFQTPTVTPSIDAILEFKVLQNAYSAEFGRGATQILAAMRSGTNEFHGTLFEFIRNDKMSARSFFQPGKPADLKQNQFGATFGGPIVKNRTFFFGDYSGQRIRTGGTSFALVPTQAQLQGDFSAPGDPLIYDPLTFDAASRTRQQFPGNRIPASRLSSSAQKVAELYPEPNYTGLVGRNYARNVSQLDDNNQGSMRVDHRFTDSDNFFVRYSVMDGQRTAHGIMPYSGSADDMRGQNGALNWVHSFTPALLNEVRVGFNRGRFYTQPDSTIAPNAPRDYFGFTNTTSNPLTSFGHPVFNMSGGFSSLGPASSLPTDTVTQTWQLVNNLTWVRGPHTVRAGIDFRRASFMEVAANNDRGAFSFTGQYTSQPNVTGTGSAVADLLLGVPYTAAAAVGDQTGHNYNELYSAYLQDDWKISTRLTLNLGVRYEYVTPWREKLDHYAILDFQDARGRMLLCGTSQAFVPGTGIVDTGKPAMPRSCFSADRNNWAPRVGLAFRPMDRTSIRAGYGIFYDVQEANEAHFLTNNVPFFFVQNYTSDALVPNLRLDNLFPAVTTLPTGAIQPYTLATSRAPYMQQWNFDIQRELLPNLLFEVGYAGSKGTHLLRRTNFQQWPGILVEDPANPTPLASRVRYPNLSSSLIFGSENGGASSYHGLLTKLERRFSNGFAFLVSYTFSKSIDDASSSSNFDGTPTNAQCRCDLAGAKGPSAFDISHRAVFSFGYELPFGKGKALLNQTGLVDKIAGGWQLNGIGFAQTGPPFQINTQGDNASIGSGAGSGNNQRPNLVGDQFGGIDTSADIHQRGVDPGTYYFNRAAFAMPPLFRLGNLGKNTMRGPGGSNWDLSLFKNTRITERFNTQFRAEFFDAFNQSRFGLPGLIVGTPTFGVITGSEGRRIIQFGLKVQF